MGTSVLTIGVTGLNAAQAGIQTTAHNISNASTPGYTRQQIVQRSNTAMFTGAGFLGQGTSVETVQRIYDQFLSSEVLSAQSGMAEMDAYQKQIDEVANLFGDTASGLGPALTGFFSGVQEVAASPASLPARQAMLSGAQTLVARFQSLDQRLTEIRSGTNAQIASEVGVINSYATQIADINQRIIIAESAGTGQPANDLLDQRDQLISDLSKEIGVSTLQQSDGSYSVFIGSGQPLVIGNDVAKLEATQDSSDPQKTVIALRLPIGTLVAMSDSLLSGGKLGGLLAFRNQSLDVAQNALGRIAIGVAQTINDQHRLGQDLDGVIGGDFMKVATPLVFANSNNPAPPVGVSVTIDDVGVLTTSDYLLTSNGGGLYTLQRLSDNQTLLNNTALPSSIDGLTITPAAVPPSGASYLIQPTRAGARNIGMVLTDLRKIAAAAPIRTAAVTGNKGTATIDAGVVDSVTATPPLAAITLRYLTSPAPSLDGFPVGATVDVGTGVLYKITSPTTQVPYTVGNNISFNGIGVKITGVPANGDAFTIGPQPGPMTPVANTGLAALFGVPAASTSRGVAVGSTVPGFPLTLTATDNQFDISLDGAPVTTITLTAGTYNTAALLAGAMQTAIGAGATVSIDTLSGALVVNSTTTGAGSSVVLSATGGNTGYTSMFGGVSTSGTRGLQVGGLVLGNPVNIVAGVNDRFTVDVNGAGPQMLILPAGSYTPTTLATQLQTTVNALVASPGVTVAVNGANQLTVTSNLIGVLPGASSIVLAAMASGAGAMSAGTVTQSGSLPVAPLTVTYTLASNSLSGFPVGASVSVSGDTSSPYAITSTLDQVPYSSGATISFNGISFTIAGTPADGDDFTVGPNTGGVNDGRNAVLLGQLPATNILEGNATGVPAATYQSAYATIVGQIGNTARQVQVNGQAQQSLAEQATNLQQSVSGVNLDEEAANLLRYQQAYQAAAKVISIASKLFDTLLAAQS